MSKINYQISVFLAGDPEPLLEKNFTWKIIYEVK